MNINEVKELIELINSSDIAYFEIKNNEGHIKMDKSLTRNIDLNNPSNSLDKVSKIIEKEPVEKVVKETINEETKHFNKEIKEEVLEGKIIKSPMVGTFYASPSPNSKSYVEVGSKIKKGDTLCIIEAMKLMNEIESEFSGEILNVLVKEGDMVEYGTPLFSVKEEN